MTTVWHKLYTMQVALVFFFFSLLFGQLGGISPAPGVTFYIHDIVLGAVFLVGIFEVVRRKKVFRPALFLPITSFIFIATVSLIVNFFRFNQNDMLQSSLYLLRWGTYAWFYIILVQRRVSPVFVLYGLFGFGTGVSVLGLVQYVLYPELRNLSYLGWDPHYYRLFSTFLDPNFAGIIIVFTVFLGIYFWRKTRHTSILFVEVLNIIALYLTYSRSSYLAFVVGTAVLIVFRKKWKAFVLLVFFVLAIVLVPKPGGNTLLLTRMDSTLARVGNWQDSLGIIGQAPIIGHGFNTLRFLHTPDVQGAPGAPVSRSAAGVDSSVLFLLATTGVIGTIVYGWIMWSMIRLYQVHRSTCELQGILWSVLTSLFVHSLFTNSLFYPWVMIWLWVFVAACELSVRPQKKKGA